MNVTITFHNNQDKCYISSEDKELIQNVIQKIIENQDIKQDIKIDLTITDNTTIKGINEEFRNLAKATDVLSFPLIDFNNNEGFSNINYDYESKSYLLGDIIISIEKVKEQAKEYKHSFERELAYLTAHSTLHLLGYDHKNREDEHIMNRKIEIALNQLNVN